MSLTRRSETKFPSSAVFPKEKLTLNFREAKENRLKTEKSQVDWGHQSWTIRQSKSEKVRGARKGMFLPSYLTFFPSQRQQQTSSGMFHFNLIFLAFRSPATNLPKERFLSKVRRGASGLTQAIDRIHLLSPAAKWVQWKRRLIEQVRGGGSKTKDMDVLRVH